MTTATGSDGMTTTAVWVKQTIRPTDPVGTVNLAVVLSPIEARTEPT
jgi:hypothetical protein